MTLFEEISSAQRFHAEACRTPPAAPDLLTHRELRRLSAIAQEAYRTAQREYVHGLVIPTHDQRALGMNIREHADMCKQLPAGAQRSLFVVGAAGTGKSTGVDLAAHRFHRDELARWGVELTPARPVMRTSLGRVQCIPVVRILLNPETKQKGVVAQFASFLGYDTQRTAADLSRINVDLAQRHGVRLVVLDDVHNLALSGKSAHSIHNQIKNMNTQLGGLGIAMVLITLPPGSGPSLTDDEQMESRLIRRSLDPYSVNVWRRSVSEDDDSCAWQEHLEEWERALQPVLPNLVRGDLSSEFGRRLWLKTFGYIVDLAPALKGAASNALRTGRTSITKGDIDVVPDSERVRRLTGEMQSRRRAS